MPDSSVHIVPELFALMAAILTEKVEDLVRDLLFFSRRPVFVTVSSQETINLDTVDKMDVNLVCL